MFIQTEATPNPATLKFLPGRAVLASGTLDMRDTADAAKSPLAERLFDIAGVDGVFFGSDFITVTKADGEWQQLKPAILGAIMEHFMSGAPLLASGEAAAPTTSDEFFDAKRRRDRRHHQGPDRDAGAARRSPTTAATSPSAASRTASSISHMKGACSGCPSSTATLRHGIQNLLQALRAGRGRSPADVDASIRAVRRHARPCAGHRGVASDACTAPMPLFAAMTVLDRSMRVLAIDTALEACSAAVLDTERGDRCASESLPMARGHAEALMPLIARVMDAGRDRNSPSSTASPSPPAPAASPDCASASRRRAASRSRPASRRSASPRSPPSPRRYIADDDSAPVAVAIDARHEHVYLQVFGPGGRTLVAPRIAPLRDAVRAATTGPARIVGSAAQLLAAAWPTSEPPPLLVEQRGAPDIDWVARLGAAAAEGHGPPKPLYLRAPDAQPQDAARLPRR